MLHHAASIHHRRRLLLGGRSVSASQSTLVNSSFTGSSGTLTYTARNAGGSAMAGVPVTFTVNAAAVISAANTLVTADPSAIDNDGVATSTITVALVDTDGDPVAGWAAASNVLAATGTGNTLTQPAAVSTFGGLQTGTLVSTNAATKVVSATVGSLAITDTASVVVGTPVADLTPVFFSDWATQTPGTTAAAKTDSSKWNYGTPIGGSVVASTGLGFPATMANVFLAPWNTASGWAFLRKTDMSVPAVGDSRYYRWYFRMVIADGTADNQTHPVQDGFDAPSSNWEFVPTNTGAAGTWRPDIWYNAASYPGKRWESNTQLNKNQTYRFEVRITRTATTTFTSSFRVYNSSNTLVLDDSNFMREDSGGSVNLSSQPSLPFVAAANLAGLNAGTNDTGSEAGDYAYEGGFAVCDNQGYIGAYGSVAGEP
jgi:hypothetical protein